MNGSHVIVTHSLTKRFGRKLVLDQVDLHVPRGAIYGLIGPNGVGKTTLLRLLLNLYTPTGGGGAVLGLDIVRETVQIKRRVGHVAALQPLWEWMTVGRYARFLAGCYHKWNQEPVSGILSRVGIKESDVIRQLSRGQRALVSVAMAIGHGPEVLLLDEALTGLDPLARREVLRSVVDAMHDEGRTVLITGQDLADMERICDYVGLLIRGRLVWESSLDEMKARVKRLRITHPPDAAPPLPEGALAVTRETRATTFTVRDFTPDLVTSLGGNGHTIEVLDLGLEDIFVDLARPSVEG